MLHWIRSVPGRCDDVVVVVRFGTYKAGFQVKDRAAPVVCVGRNTSVVFIISLYYGRLLSHHVWLTGIFAFVLKCPHTVVSFPLAFSSVVTVVFLPQLSIFLCHRVVAMTEDEGEFALWRDELSCFSWTIEGRWLWAWPRLRDELLWKLKVKWSEVRKEAVRGGRLHRDSTLMGEVDLNHQSLVIGRLLYLTTSAPGIRTRELPIGKQEC